jgi:transcriptional regulator with XRE-family HTH domain
VITGRRERQEAGGFAERLRQVIKAHGSASGLAKAISRSEGAVRKWLRGESEPNVTDLRALGEVTHTSIEWLVSGQGAREMRPTSDASRGNAQPHLSSAAEAPAAQRQHLSHGPQTTLDVALLEAVIGAVDEQLRAAGPELSAAKRSALIAAVYDLAHDRNAVDAGAVARLVRLAR